MKPEYANTFGLRKVADPQGQIQPAQAAVQFHNQGAPAQERQLPAQEGADRGFAGAPFAGGNRNNLGHTLPLLSTY